MSSAVFDLSTHPHLNYLSLLIYRYDGPNGILGFLFPSFVRPSDNLPVTGTILFDTVDFNNMLDAGKVGKLIGYLLYFQLLHVQTQIITIFSCNRLT
jgi:hypothetical protein